MLKLSSIILQPATFEELGAENGFNEEIIQQCCVAVKQEHSRCLLQEQTMKLTNKQHQKVVTQHTFKMQRRKERLDKAIPYNLQPQCQVELNIKH